MCSNSSTSSTSSDSLNGLKFGQKIYFEDVGPGVPAKYAGGGSSFSAGGGSSAPPSSPAKRGRSGDGIVQGLQPPRCQVEGCNVDLSDAKAYYSRHKVCGMHSKTPKVIVSGLEQRFCQQCSRFHQLPEFDLGKRSCRRRLAGHNERRRKPPPGSLLSTRYGSSVSSIFENNSGTGRFLMDFTSYPRPTWRDQWPPTRASEQVSGNQCHEFGKILPKPGQTNSEGLSTELQGSANRTPYHGPGIPQGGCFSGVTAPSRAYSFLSDQSCGSRNQSSSLEANYHIDIDGSHMIQPAVMHGKNMNQFSSNSWDFKGNEAGTSSLNMHPQLGPGHISQTGNSRYAEELLRSPQRALEHSRAYDSSVHDMHWSL